MLQVIHVQELVKQFVLREVIQVQQVLQVVQHVLKDIIVQVEQTKLHVVVGTACNSTTGACTACASGYELKNSVCEQGSNELLFTYTGSYSETYNADGKQKIYLKSDGTFTALNTTKATLFIVGAGGGGGGYGGGGGGGGYTNQTLFTFNANSSYEVIIGVGRYATCNSTFSNGWDGTQTKFGTLVAEPGKGGDDTLSGAGGSGTGNGGNSGKNGNNGIIFDGEWFGSGGGGGNNNGGGPGTVGGERAGNGGYRSINGTTGVPNSGGGGGAGGYGGCGNSGGSGVVIILVN